MNQDNYPRSDWYASAAPNPQANPQASAQAPGGAPAPAPKKTRNAAKIVGIAACALVVVLGSVIVFSGRGAGWNIFDAVQFGKPVITIEIPGDRSGGDEPDALPEDYDGDYRDYFFKSYTERAWDDTAPSDVARTEPGAEFRIQLQSAAALEERTLQELYAECLPSVVGVRTFVKGRPGYYMGTGIVMSEDGYILTNQHLLAGTDTAYVTLDTGETFNALLVGEDSSSDLAVLKIEAAGLTPAVFGDSGELTVGDGVFAIGNPIEPALEGTLTSGIISGLRRSVSSGARTTPLLQHTAPINEGNSGGPLFNMYGQVVGITNMKIVNRYSDVPAEGLCFAIPSATAKAVTDQLFADGHYVRPGIGITVGAVITEDAEHYDIPGGLYVTAVSAGSDAAGKIRVGDIVTHANGTPVRETDDLLEIRDSLRVGDTLTLTVFRDGETLDVEIELFDWSTLY